MHRHMCHTSQKPGPRGETDSSGCVLGGVGMVCHTNCGWKTLQAESKDKKKHDLLHDRSKFKA